MIDDARTFPRTDAEFEAKWDAETLAKADLIKKNPGRLEKAQVAAGKIAEQEREEANAMSRVAGRKRATGTGSGGSKPKIVENSSGKQSGHNVFQKI